MRGIGRVHVGPTSGYVKILLAYFQKLQDALNGVIHTRFQLAKFIEFVEVGSRLPTPTGGPWSGTTYFFELAQDALVDASINLGFELGLPYERRKHAQDVSRRKDGFSLSNHFNDPG
jgi:hypothetical protein